MELTPEEKAEWQRRVDAEAAKMDLSHVDVDPELRDALAHLMAAYTLWDLDQMKKPGILHQVLRSRD